MRAPFAPPRLSEPRKVAADAQAVETSSEIDQWIAETRHKVMFRSEENVD